MSAPSIVGLARRALIIGLLAAGVALAAGCSGDSLVEFPAESGPECQSAADCEAGQTCEAGVCITADVFDGDVAEDTGPDDVAQDTADTNPDECADESDCPAGQTCQPQDVGGQTVNKCVDETVPCDSNSACAASQACVADRSGGGVSFGCAQPVGPGQLGDACTADGECRSNLCVDGQCTRPCARPTDCGDGQSFVCDNQNVGGTDVQICVARPPESCLADSDCSSPEVCTASRTATDVEWTCGLPNSTPASPGDACANDDECVHNFCNDGLCTEPCIGVGDCSVADATCEVTSVDLGGGNTDSTQVCLAPTPCEQDDACRVSEVCYLRNPTGAADLVCLDPNPGGGELGELCAGPSACAANICYPGRFFDYCGEACVDDTDCNAAGYECQSVPVPGTGLTAGLCVPSDPPACSSDADCVSGTRCAIVETAAGGALESVCVPDFGGQDSGTSCSQDLDCASLVCHEGFCAAPCADNSQCAGTRVCTPRTIQKGVNSGDFDICYAPDACASDADCTGGDRCVATKTATAVDFGCRAPIAGGAETGAACAADADCAQNLCHDGVCVGPCATLNHCPAGEHYTCENTPIDLGGSLTDDARVCIPPTDCIENSDCSGTDVCYIDADTTAGSADLYCHGPNAGGGGPGQVCSSDGNCASNLCYPGRFRDICTVGCRTDADCTVAGYECRSATIPGTSTSASLCLPADPPPCSRVADCATGTSCAVVVDSAGTGLESVCIPSTGGKATGTACSQGSQCASQVCIAGHCAAPCTDSAQCAAGQLCRTNSVTKNSLSDSFDLCETLADQSCSTSADCTDGVRVCSDLRYEGDARVPYCQFPNVGAGQLGASCSQDSDCYEAMCLGFASECSVVCQTDADCGANQGCTTYDFPDAAAPDTTVGVCNTTCSRDADCGTGRVCTTSDDDFNNEIDQVCLDPLGPGALGVSCTFGSDCRSGLCLRTYSYTSRTCSQNTDCNSGEECRSTPQGNRCATVSRECTALCIDDTDCVGSGGNQLTSCTASTTIPTPGGGLTTISTCSKP